MHLTRTDDVSALVDALPGRVGLDAVWDDLDRHLIPSKAPGRAVAAAWAWDAADQADERWWPQGISVAAGSRRIATTWYAKDGGSRVSFLDLDVMRYRHVELARPTPDGLEPLRVHAGGIAWSDPTLYVAGTRTGLWVCDTGDVVREPHRYVLPVRHRLAPSAPFRFSFVAQDPDGILVGEYDNAGLSRRLAYGRVNGLLTFHDTGIARSQGAVRVGGRWYVSSSNGKRKPGSLWSGPLGAMREQKGALPVGPEDLAYDEATDRLWTVTEYPGKRWIVAIDR